MYDLFKKLEPHLLDLLKAAAAAAIVTFASSFAQGILNMLPHATMQAAQVGAGITAIKFTRRTA